MKEMQTLNETEEYLTAKLKSDEKSKFFKDIIKTQPEESLG